MFIMAEKKVLIEKPPPLFPIKKKIEQEKEPSHKART